MNRNLNWKTWEYVDYQQKTGKVVSKKILVTKNGSVRKCLDELIYTDVMKPGKSFTFVQHFFTQSFQFQMYLDNILALKPGQCLGVQDFARNLEVSFRVEIKASNWSKQQMTVHPHVFYFKTSETEETQRLVIFHLSDIAKHDAQLVHHMTQDCINILSEKYPNEKWEKFYLWSDGCVSQYKGKSSFYYLDKFKVEVERNFFGSEHGKNECDAMTGHISVQYQNAVKADDIIIMNAADLKKYLEKIYETDKSKIFKLVTANDEDLVVINQDFNNVEIQVLDGTCTRKLHQIKADRNKGCLLTRPFSCFCHNCLNNDLENCYNKSFTGGKFTERQLNSGRKDDINRKKRKKRVKGKKNKKNVDKDEVRYEDSEGDEVRYEDGAEDDMILDDIDIDNEIRVEKQDLEFTDLKVNDFIIVPVKDRCNKVHNFPAQITKLKNNGNIHINYLKQNFDQPQVLLRYDSNEENNFVIPLEDIIMKLPEPKTQRRNRIVFSKNIMLK